MSRVERVGAIIMLASAGVGVFALFLLMLAIDWFEVGYELARS